MQVNINGAKISFSFLYTSLAIAALIMEKGIEPADARKMKKSELAEALDLPNLPLPSNTECLIRNETGEVLSHSEVIKHVDHVYNKDKARKYALKKALFQLYPEHEDKNNRRQFWNAYLQRISSKQEKLFLKLMKKYENLVPVAA